MVACKQAPTQGIESRASTSESVWRKGAVSLRPSFHRKSSSSMSNTSEAFAGITGGRPAAP